MRIPSTAMLILLLFVAVACDNQPAAQPSSPKNGTDPAPATADAPQPEPETERPKLPPVGVCAFITGAEVTQVTGQEYNGALSAAAFADLSHCEYRQNRHTVALLIASGEGAVQRMEKAKTDGSQAVEGFEDGAVWDPYQGKLTAMSGVRCVEVSISPNHADPPKHIDHAKALANIVFAKVPAQKE